MIRYAFLLFVISLFSIPYQLFAEDSLFLKVHFLYGSKPKKEFRNVESKWFGGKLGGHVGVEYTRDTVIDFIPSGKFHVFGKKFDRHSRFAIRHVDQFWEIFGGKPSEVKKATVIIPINSQQKLKLDSIVKAYHFNTPYDYAFFGMRCGAAAHDILAQLEILKKYSTTKTSFKIFYPKKLRKKIFRLANQRNWKINRQRGSDQRIWEKD